MNRRIVLIDDAVSDVMNFYGCGLGDEIMSVNHLEQLDPEILKQTLLLGPGDGALLVGGRAFELIKRFFHLGIRSENYYDCSILRRLGIEGGAFIKVLHEEDPITPDIVNFFMSQEFCIKREFPGYKYQVVKTYLEAKPWLDYFLGLPVGAEIGFDYEASGMPMDKEFCITGAAFALAYDNVQCAVFFSFQDMRKNDSPDIHKLFRESFAQVLWKHQENIWTFNQSYETQVTWREFGIECNFCDASVYNVLDGLHSKNYSLKWTAQRLLGGGDKYHLPGIIEGPGIEPWDTDFDKLGDLFENLYYANEYVKGKKKPIGKVIKCNEYDWWLQPEWPKIKALYPGYTKEFELLVQENFGNPFLNMPADILGKYCCLDSFYTVLIHLENKNRYSDLCRETFINNQRAYSTLTRSGLYINDDYRKKYERYCHKMIFWGVLYLSSYRCFKKIKEHQIKANKLEKYPEFSKLLLKKNEFCKGDTIEIARNLLAQNIDLSDSYDTGLDEGGLVLKYNNKFASAFIKIVKESITETKFKGKIDETIARKKKLIGSVAEKLNVLLGIDKINLGEKHEELEKLLFYQSSYSELIKIWNQVGTDINNFPEIIKWGKKKYDIYDLSEILKETYYRCSSPIDNVELETEWINEFKFETLFLATIGRDTNKLPAEKNYYKNLGINNIEDAFNHFMYNYEIFCKNIGPDGICNWPNNINHDYPDEIFILANELWNDQKNDLITNIWGTWDEQKIISGFFPDQTKGEEPLMRGPWSEEDMKLGVFTRMRKIILNILLLKKYEKLRSTYVCDTGLFNAGSKYVIETPKLIPTRDANPGEPGAVKKTFLKYKVMQLETKRSSSGYHTIASHQDSKACVTCPVLDTPGTRTGKTATLLSYFDIILKIVSLKRNLMKN